MMPPKAPDLAELQMRLKAFGLMIKLGDDIYNAPDFASAAALAVNSSRSLLQFKSSVLLERAGNKVSIAGQYAQFSVNEYGEQALAQKKLAAVLDFSAGDMLILTRETLEKLPPKAAGALEEVLEGDDPILAIRLPAPAFLGQPGFDLIWLIEFVREIPPYAKNAASILARSYGYGLFSRRCCRKGGFSFKGNGMTKKIVWGVVLLLLLILMFLPVREQLSAEFVLKAPERASAYAWIDGTIARCLKKDGDTVKAGEVIVRYDLNLPKFRLATAENQFQEIRKEYELESRAAFSDRTRLGRVKLLEAKLASASVAVKEARWYLEHAEIKAPASGTLALADGSVEKLENKAVRLGERLFDVYSGKGAVAEIQVNERESSILSGPFEASLFPYTAPELGIKTKILDVHKTPELTEQRTWCYMVRAGVDETAGLRYGVRGIAQLRGKRVTLGYYLFRNVVIYLRWL